MQHVGTQMIKTPRLTLRRFTMDDVQAVYSNWANDPDVTKFLCWQPHADVEVSKKILDEWVESYAKKDYYQWAIVPDDIREPIGCIAAVKQDDEISMVHIGYALGKAWWHQGIMSEALAAVMKFFFTEVGVNRVESRHDPNNPHSGGVMKKCGMKYEGTLRQGDHSNIGIVDACMYAILRKDWSQSHE